MTTLGGVPRLGRALYAAMGGEGASLEAALAYSNVVFAGTVLVWLFNALASVIRGTGNMLVPALSVCLRRCGAADPALAAADLRLGHRCRRFGIAGGALAVLIVSYAHRQRDLRLLHLVGTRRRCGLRRGRRGCTWPLFADILRVGARRVPHQHRSDQRSRSR